MAWTGRDQNLEAWGKRNSQQRKLESRRHRGPDRAQTKRPGARGITTAVAHERENFDQRAPSRRKTELGHAIGTFVRAALPPAGLR